jgi:hypothetical protein
MVCSLVAAKFPACVGGDDEETGKIPLRLL